MKRQSFLFLFSLFLIIGLGIVRSIELFFPDHKWAFALNSFRTGLSLLSLISFVAGAYYARRFKKIIKMEDWEKTEHGLHSYTIKEFVHHKGASPMFAAYKNGESVGLGSSKSRNGDLTLEVKDRCELEIVIY